MNNMKYFIRMWEFFDKERHNATTGNSVLCGLDKNFCNMVLKKITAITGAPAPNAFDTKPEQLCGYTPNGRFYALVGLEEHGAIYEIELACVPNDGMPAHYIVEVRKKDFDAFLTRIMLYVNPELDQEDE